MKLKGGNEFLSGAHGGISSGIRRDFIDTKDGIKRRDGKVVTLACDVGVTI